MKIFMVTDENGAARAYWTAERAQATGRPVVEVEMETLPEIITRYYRYRGMAFPNELQSLAFLTSELGELADAIVEGDGERVRSNPDRERDPAPEAGDVLMMLYVTVMQRGIDPLNEMLAKWRRKGFNQ